MVRIGGSWRSSHTSARPVLSASTERGSGAATGAALVAALMCWGPRPPYVREVQSALERISMESSVHRPAVDVSPGRPRPGIALGLALRSVPGSTLAWDLPAGGLWSGLP